MEVSDARKLNALEDENAKLKKLAGRDQGGQRHSKRCRFKKVVTFDVKRDAVAHV